MGVETIDRHVQDLCAYVSLDNCLRCLEQCLVTIHIDLLIDVVADIDISHELLKLDDSLDGLREGSHRFAHHAATSRVRHCQHRCGHVIVTSRWVEPEPFDRLDRYRTTLFTLRGQRALAKSDGP